MEEKKTNEPNEELKEDVGKKHLGAYNTCPRCGRKYPIGTTHMCRGGKSLSETTDTANSVHE